MVITNREAKIAYVYPGSSKLGYVVTETTEKFWEDLNKRALCGAEELKYLSEYGKIVELPTKETEEQKDV